MERLYSLYRDVNMYSGTLRITTVGRPPAFKITYASFRYQLLFIYLAVWQSQSAKPRSMSLEQAMFVSVVKLTCCSCDKHTFANVETSSGELEVNCRRWFSTDVLFHYSSLQNLEFAVD